MRFRIACGAFVLGALSSGSALAAPVKLPKTLETPTGNFITLYAVSTGGGYSSVDVKVCTSAHTPPGMMVIPSFYALRFEQRLGSIVRVTGSSSHSPHLGLTPLGPKQCARGWLSFAGGRRARSRRRSIYTYGADRLEAELSPAQQFDGVLPCVTQ
jgi:hypothetical protein